MTTQLSPVEAAQDLIRSFEHRQPSVEEVKHTLEALISEADRLRRENIALDCDLEELDGELLTHTLIRALGEDPDREGLEDTPHRFFKAMKFYTQGYEQNPRNVLKTFGDGAEKYDELVFQRDIPIWSLCEHHMAPFFGVAHIGYLPNKRVVGLSKLARLADIFARRLQVQERLTVQIADALEEHLQPNGVGVVLECRHSCMESRGVCKAGTVTVTSALRGSLRAEPDARAEFLSFVHSGHKKLA